MRVALLDIVERQISLYILACNNISFFFHSNCYCTSTKRFERPRATRIVLICFLIIFYIVPRVFLIIYIVHVNDVRQHDVSLRYARIRLPI